MRILVVEDDRDLARYLELALTHEGYQVTLAHDGEEGLRLASSDQDLVLLDVMLPGLGGMQVLQALRRRSGVPVILLTARDRTEDKVQGLDLGADDYLTKPFKLEELLARIRSVARRQQGPVQDVLEVGDLRLDRLERSVQRAGRPIELTKREFALLEYLMNHAEGSIVKSDILEAVWGSTFDGDPNIVEVYIGYLRRKIDVPDQPSIIRTVRGVGYSVREA